MCLPALPAALAGLGGAAAGTAATGWTVGSVLSLAGTAASIGGSVLGAVQSSQAARTQADYLAQQSATERQLALVEDQRTRERMRAAIAQQRAELAGRGVSLDSPTAILLGRKAASEMSFASQSVRSTAAARQAELSVAEQGYRARATTALLTGGLSAAGDMLTRVPQLWPGLSDRRMLG